jgi:hypothetical protein
MKKAYEEIMSILDNKQSISRRDRAFIKIFIKDLMQRLEDKK